MAKAKKETKKVTKWKITRTDGSVLYRKDSLFSDGKKKRYEAKGYKVEGE